MVQVSTGHGESSQKTAAVEGGVRDAAIMEIVSCSRPLQLIFFPPFLSELLDYHSVPPPRRAEMQSVTHSHPTLTLNFQRRHIHAHARVHTLVL